MKRTYQHSAQTTVYVTVKLVLAGSADPTDIVENLDYSFNHEAIVSTEIITCEPF